jgi:hypothetical protein
MTRAALADVGLSRSTVQSVIEELAEAGMVIEIGPDTASGIGRPPILVGLRGSLGVTVGVEIANWTIRVAVCDLAQELLLHSSIPTDDRSDPVTTLTRASMAWILQGYQCGSVYKAIYKEVQDAVAMATILLSGQKPPAALQNGTTVDPADTTITEPASLLTPVWVTKANMESTVVKDGFDTAKDICALAGTSACAAAGIS